MSGTTLLLNLAGAIALLLWGTHMISTALLRGFGTQLRNWMGRNLNNRWMALISGIGITGVLQSSTAVSLMATSFTAAGTLGLAIAALAVLAWRARARRRPWLEIALVGVVLIQALLGMLTVTKLLKPVIVTSHLLGGMSTLALLALLWLRERHPGRQPVATPPGLRLLAAAALLVVLIQIALGGWVSSNYAAAICADFPTCQGSWWPEMDTHHAFTLDRELGATASGALLPGAALTAIHWTHRLFAGLVLIVAGSLGLRLLTRAETRACGRMLLAALGLQIGLGIANVLLQLPLPLAVAHNTGAALLLCATLAAVSRVFTRNEARGRFPAAGFPRRFQVVR